MAAEAPETKPDNPRTKTVIAFKSDTRRDAHILRHSETQSNRREYPRTYAADDCLERFAIKYYTYKISGYIHM